MVNHPIGHLNVMKLIFSILALLLVTVLTAQTQQYPAVKEGIYVDQNGNPFSGSAMLESTSNGIAQQQYIEVVNGQLHGIIKYYHPKGYVEETGSYVNGQKEGQWIQFASNGVKLGEAFYKNGKKDGIWTVWDEQGIKRYHMVYSMGKKVDTWKMWDENAVLVSERIYNE